MFENLVLDDLGWVMRLLTLLIGSLVLFATFRQILGLVTGLDPKVTGKELKSYVFWASFQLAAGFLCLAIVAS